MRTVNTLAITDRRFLLQGLEVMVRIGIYDAERLAPQRVIIDVELVLDADTAPQADDVNETLNYDLIRNTVMDIVGRGHFDLQETLARALFDQLAMLPDVTGLRVRTAKPDAYEDCETIAYQLSSFD
ncbi:MAG: dihydroneopterin aldolase [Candidatus Puniceispirillum sp.]|uniref:dihydroneopterin aldolase n=1 Tax=Candidatus Puniceispirillum sp. TaxID=2026719 RepID=UPI001EBB4EC5|nr:dihydroneopterin aldolase [Candidatus Puniceispirillum sp.]MBT6414826.1 dihydroneopterin aldolase [Candidatus Puniceispirillum sp.]MBT6566690.1 dihydroneopterin aldolase [Candidatus Puniceispirillum sp.]